MSSERNLLMKQLLRRSAIRSMAKNRFSEALVSLTNAIRLDPNDWRLFNSRSVCNQWLGRLDSALADAETVILMNGLQTDGYYLKGCVLMAQNRFRSAEESFKSALKVDFFDEKSINKLKENVYLFIKEFSFSAEQTGRLVEQYDSCTAFADALTSGEVTQLLGRIDVHSESLAEMSDKIFRNNI